MRGKVDFARMDGDDAETHTLMDKYGVSGYPSLVWTDATGKSLQKTRQFDSSDHFKSAIQTFLDSH